jgi:hypothetical protein
MDPEPQEGTPILVGSFKLARNSKGKTWEIKVNENFNQEKNDAMFQELIRMNDQFEHQFGEAL